METYKFSELQIGQKVSFKHKITQQEQDNFGMISGDYNLLHTDSEFAKKRGFSDKVVYGMLAASYYSTLVGMYLPGENCLLNGVDITFIKPVYINDELTVSGEIFDMRESTHRIRIKAKMIRADGEIVNEAQIIVSMTEGE